MKPSVRSVVAILLPLVLTSCGGGGDSSSSGPPLAVAGWVRQAGNPLIVPTLTSTTLHYGPADPTVMFDAQDGKWKAWFSWTIKDIGSGSETMTIQYSESVDGVAWSTPQTAFQVSADANAWDHTHSETPTVIKNPTAAAPASQKFMLWYAGANRNLAASENRPTNFPYYQIGLAYSADGKSFTRVMPGLNSKPGLVLSASAALFGAGLPGTYGDGLIADPDVIFRDNVFHMWFSSYAETVPSPVGPAGRTPLAFGIAHATSTDGINWSFPHGNPLATLAKSGEVAAGQQPSVLFNPAASRYEMWFSNDSAAETASIPCSFNTVVGFWRAVSNDGVNWTPDYGQRDFTYSTQYGYEALGFLTGVNVVLVNGTYHAYYSAWGAEQIPNTTLYLCPNQQGQLIPAVLTLNRATYR